VNRLIIHRVAIALVGTILGISAWLPFQMMGHAKTHVHHQAATHASPLCTLFCSAGQMAQMADPTPTFAQSYVYNLEISTFTAHLAMAASRLLARGPPAHPPLSLKF
jgi:hypothetical protein